MKDYERKKETNKISWTNEEKRAMNEKEKRRIMVQIKNKSILSGMPSTLSLPLLRDPLWLRMVVAIRVPFIGQIDPFVNPSYPPPLLPRKKTLKNQLRKNININVIS